MPDVSPPAPAHPFAFRLGVPSDLPGCLPALRPGDPARGLHDAGLVRLWQRCLGHGAFVVIERVGKARSGTIDGFGLSVFVPDVFADRYFTDPQPGVTLEFFRGLAAGEPVLLSEPQVARANAGSGINVLVLHFGSRLGDFSDPQTLALHALVGSSFYFSHGGHRIRSILAETYGADATRFAEDGQFRRLKDFAAATPTAYAHVPLQERPHLVGLRRDWVLGAGWYPMAQLFSSVVPRIYFSRTERRVLERAMLGEPDQVIADALGLSAHTVKSAWKHAIQRAGDTLDGLFPGGSSRDGGTRGREKRVYLLTYLREHMEELRPYPRERARTTARVPARR